MANSTVTPAASTETIYFSAQGNAKANGTWFRLDDPGAAMVETAKHIVADQGWKKSNYLRLARLYEDRPLASLYSQRGSSAMLDEVIAPQRTSWNLCRAACQVAQSRVGRSRGRVMFVSVDGNWSLRRKARLRTRFIDGAFRQADVYAESQLVFSDAVVFGIGILYVYTDGKGKLRSERVLPNEIIVDTGAGLHRRPRTIYRQKMMLKVEAISRYAGKPSDPEYAKRVKCIEAAQCQSLTGMDRGARTDLCDIFMGWHLPDENDEGGRYVVAVDGCTLADEEWNRPRLPFSVFRWEHSISGWTGLGIVEQLRGRQLKIRRLLHNIDVSTYHVATPKILAHSSSKINAKQINNDLRGTVVYWSGAQPPQWITPQAVSPEVYQQLQSEWMGGFEEIGLPPGGTGAPPTNLKSGEAIRNWGEAIDSRLAMPAQRWDQYYVNTAELLLDEARERQDVMVEAKVGRTYQRINWQDVAEGDDDLVLQAWPSNLLPASPSGKYDRLSELTEAGWISKDQAVSLLDLPDMESFLSLETSSFELISKHIELMLDEGKHQQPDEYQNLSLSIKLVQAAVLKASADGCPSDILDIARTYIDQCRELLQQNQPVPSAAPPGAAPPGADPSMGALPPDPNAMPPDLTGGAPVMPPEAMPPTGMPAA